MFSEDGVFNAEAAAAERMEADLAEVLGKPLPSRAAAPPPPPPKPRARRRKPEPELAPAQLEEEEEEEGEHELVEWGDDMILDFGEFEESDSSPSQPSGVPVPFTLETVKAEPEKGKKEVDMIDRIMNEA